MGLCYPSIVGRRPAQTGIYVEIAIDAPLDRVWELTQSPALHQRWDLRFTEIKYLPRGTQDEPQCFLYETRIGFGVAIRGTGESVATRTWLNGEAISSLKFYSSDPKSLIREGAGYWRYLPLQNGGLRFLTWYDYRVRFGWMGRVIDTAVFRPLMGCATAWSFDRLRLWAENDLQPEQTMRLAVAHAIARASIAFVWLWHGLVPKLIFRDHDEQTMLAQAGMALRWLPWIGAAEIILGLLVLALWRWRGMFPLQIALMLCALLAVALRSHAYLTHAFNPVTLNLLVAAAAAAGWFTSKDVPSATRCLRIDPRLTEEHR